jgi:pyrroloquinoline quinone (PQQ) biosynthesis protein C
MGLLLETYHYVHSAPRHISVALSACTDKRWSDLLRSYLEEERVHSELILRGLENMGMPREWTLTAHPVIGTMSLIHMLCEIGRQSTLAYFTCTALFEARAEDFAEAKQAFEELGGQYGFSSEALAPIIEHMKCDAQAGHAGLLEKALEHVEHVSDSDAHLVVNCLHDLKHSYDQFHDQVLQYYSDTSNYIPRLKVDYFSL